ncbi:acyltransferase [Shewanella eurypsychrophilus]|uniref:Acyltransferase n=1 Tax=Shewanella eurypsychrophilus TaxID=2593656 RepID=A0ABX6V8B9_9GAMM|nr:MULTISPECIES: acyltransferase [Shewanella]QPG58670.2 acyltransferase [Shewanella eurypsychrophilus]
MARINFIDSLRGIAILGVIATHAASFSSYDGLFSSVILQAGYGVQLFFIISAFTIFFTLDRASQNDPRFIKNFYIKRLLRIAPVYWLGILIYTMVFGLESRGWLPGPELWHFPLHFFFINLLHPETTSSVVPGGWSISCEVLFYLICPWLFYRVNSLKKAALFFIIAMGIGIGFILLANALIKPALIELYGFKLAGQFIHRNIFSQLGIFAAGILLFFLYKDARVQRVLSAKKTCFALLFVSLIIAVIALSGQARGASHYVMGLSFMLLALVLSQQKISLFDNRLLAFVGRISFSGYIVHFGAIHIANNLLGGVSHFVPLFVLTLIITIPFSYIGFVLVERNAIKLAKMIINRQKSTSIVAS